MGAERGAIGQKSRRGGRDLNLRYYPVGLNLLKKGVLVVGGGRVAERKIRSLLPFGPRLKVVAPSLTKGLLKLSKSGKINLVKRKYSSSDLKGIKFVVAATSDKSLNQRIAGDSGEKGILINVVDNPAFCDFISTAVIKKQEAVISIFTDAKNPVLSRDLKNFLKENWNVFLSYRDKL